MSITGKTVRKVSADFTPDLLCSELSVSLWNASFVIALSDECNEYLFSIWWGGSVTVKRYSGH